MKKIRVLSCILCAFLVLNSFPIYVYAGNNSYEQICYHSPSSVNGFFSDEQLNKYCFNTWGCGSDLVNSQFLFSHLNDEGAPNLSSLGSYVIRGQRYNSSDNKIFYITVIGWDQVVTDAFVLNNSYIAYDYTYTYYLSSSTKIYSSFTVAPTEYYFNGSSWSSSTISWNRVPNSTYYVGNVSSSYGYLLGSNLPVYMSGEISESALTEYQVVTRQSEFTNLNPDGLPYVGEDGEIIEPSSGIESNENHMYFKNVDIGFCEPKNISSFSSFNGAYFYVRYTVDDWVVNHISDYRLDFQANWYVGDRQYNSHVNLALDRDGCITIPFSDLLDTTFENGFVVVQNKNVTLDQNFYKSFLYSISGGSEGADEWFNKMIAIYQQVIVFTPDGTSFLNSIKDTYKNMLRYDPFIIRAQCKLVDFDGNQSGAYAVKFDLVTGDDTVVDSSGMTNDDPFEPDDTSDDSYVPSVPSEGNSTSTQVVIYNGGQWTGNFDGTIGFDPGYSDLKNDLVADPNGNFTQYLNPLQADETVGWFASFVNYMPAEMKAILITGAGVGVLFGLYRFIRRG